MVRNCHVSDFLFNKTAQLGQFTCLSWSWYSRLKTLVRVISFVQIICFSSLIYMSYVSSKMKWVFCIFTGSCNCVDEVHQSVLSRLNYFLCWNYKWFPIQMLYMYSDEVVIEDLDHSRTLFCPFLLENNLISWTPLVIESLPIHSSELIWSSNWCLVSLV